MDLVGVEESQAKLSRPAPCNEKCFHLCSDHMRRILKLPGRLKRSVLCAKSVSHLVIPLGALWFVDFFPLLSCACCDAPPLQFSG